MRFEPGQHVTVRGTVAAQGSDEQFVTVRFGVGGTLLVDAADVRFLPAAEQADARIQRWRDEIREVIRIINWHGHTTAMRKLEMLLGEAN